MIKKFQDLLQWLFLRMEGLFNAAFGDRINPFYHLGAITFYLFWIVGASGLVHEGSAAAALLGELEYEVRASVTLTFGGGTNEIQRELVAQFGLGMPRSR